MNIKEKQNPATTSAAPVQPSPAQENGNGNGEYLHAGAWKRRVLPAERMFDGIVYGAIGTVGVNVLSILAAYWAKYGKGEEKCQNAAKSMAPALQKAFGVTAQKAHSFAQGAVMVTALMMGGLVLLIPMKKMEDKKTELVRYLHEKYGRKPTCPEEAAEDEKALQELAKEPTQTWASILIGRLIGTISNYIVLPLANDHIRSASKSIQNESYALLAKSGVPVLERTARRPLFKPLVDLGFLDILATINCTATLYLYTHLIHPFKKPEQEKPAEPVSEAEDAAAVRTPSSHVSDSDSRPSPTVSGGFQVVNHQRKDLKTPPAGHFQERVLVSEDPAQSLGISA